VGEELLSRGLELVYGGGNIGLMNVVADVVMQGGGRVIGVLPRGLESREVAHRGLTELRVVSSMHERKATMASLSDAFITLPGGIGTFEETLEVMTWSQLGIHQKPCGLLNVQGFYDGLLAFLEHSVAEGFMQRENKDRLLVAQEAGALLDQLVDYVPGLQERWLDPDEI
jgi:uncharacterized protein (TIGR00730 family)